MQSAIEAARAKRTPYGAVIVDPVGGKQIIAVNSVRSDKDPTAHAEVNAIRQAAGESMDLSRCHLISTCEPCPMCAMAAVWAGIPAIYFGAGIDDAARYGRQVPVYCRDIARQAWYDLRVEGGILREECLQLFENG